MSLQRTMLVFAIMCLLNHGSGRAVGDERADGFKPIFDGKSLSGWQGNPDHWRVDDECIVGETSDEQPLENNEFLIWNDEVGNFVLRLQFRVANRGVGNSGIQYRARRAPDVGEWAVGGYQADIDRTNQYMGILYEERGRGILAEVGESVAIRPATNDAGYSKDVTQLPAAAKETVAELKAGEWTDYEVSAHGNHLQHKINGQTIVDVTDHDTDHAAQSGLLALQLHVGPAMKIEFRNLRILKSESKPEAARLD